ESGHQHQRRMNRRAIMINSERERLRQDLINHLRNTFGEELLRLLNEPQGVQVGERVLYKLKEGTQAQRREPSSQELEALKRKHIELAKSTGADASRVIFEPPVSSGLPYPRLVDLPGNQIMWDRYLTEYLKSDDLLPSPDFPLEWVVGVLLMPSEKMLLYLDFTHPKVKAIFRASYDSSDVPQSGERAAIRNRLRQFREKKGNLESQVEQRGDILWAKLIQVDGEPQQIRQRSM